MEQKARFVGIDVAKSRIDIAVRPSGRVWEVCYDEAGMDELVTEIKSLEPELVLLEATGGVEVRLVSALATAGLPVVVVNPRQVRDFARATGKLAKTDALDAAALAHFAEAVRPPVRALRDPETQALNALVARRHQVVTMLVSEKNRLRTATEGVRRRIKAHIGWLEKDVEDLDDSLRQALRESPIWREKENLLRSVPGVGEQVSVTLLAYLPDSGQAGSSANRRSGGGCAFQSGQWQPAGQTQRVGRTCASAERTVHGGTGSQQVEPGDPGFLPAPVEGGKAEENSPRRL